MNYYFNYYYTNQNNSQQYWEIQMFLGSAPLISSSKLFHVIPVSLGPCYCWALNLVKRNCYWFHILCWNYFLIIVDIKPISFPYSMRIIRVVQMGILIQLIDSGETFVWSFLQIFLNPLSATELRTRANCRMNHWVRLTPGLLGCGQSDNLLWHFLFLMDRQT